MQSQLKHRSPIAVFFLPIVTFGIYAWYWHVKTKGELNRSGAEHIPTAWIWLIPFVGMIWWLWKYSKGVEKVTGKYNAALVFVLLFLLSIIGMAIIQDALNSVATTDKK